MTTTLKRKAPMKRKTSPLKAADELFSRLSVTATDAARCAEHLSSCSVPTSWSRRYRSIRWRLENAIAPPDGSAPRTISVKRHGVVRLDMICDAIAEIAKGADICALENYAFSRADAHAHALGELGGCVRLDLYRLGIMYAEVGPSTLKKFSTGKGNAPKQEVLIAARERFGYTGTSFDESEALILREMGLLHYDFDRRAPAAYMRDALHKIAWPVLPAAVMRA